jgi:hypothetical protein
MRPSVASLLDVVVVDAVMNPGFANSRSPIWLVMSADGLAHPFSTHEATVDHSQVVNFQYPFRLVLSGSDISISYLYISMCTRAWQQDVAIRLLARCRISFASMPRGNAKLIKFPMYNENNEEVCTVKFRATISEDRPQHIAPTFLAPAMVRSQQRAPGVA